jgi:hypothetical protein
MKKALLCGAKMLENATRNGTQKRTGKQTASNTKRFEFSTLNKQSIEVADPCAATNNEQARSAITAAGLFVICLQTNTCTVPPFFAREIIYTGYSRQTKEKGCGLLRHFDTSICLQSPPKNAFRTNLAMRKAISTFSAYTIGRDAIGLYADVLAGPIACRRQWITREDADSLPERYDEDSNHAPHRPDS